MKTLVIVSHPYPEQSKVVSALEHVAKNTSDIKVRNLETLYGNALMAFDVAAEQAAYEGMDRIIFLFPIHWFNLTPMLKAYLNAVWTYGWAFGPDGTALKDKEMLVIASAGASQHTYSHDGLIQSTAEEVLTPMKASALYVGMKYKEPVVFYNALGASEFQVEEFKQVFLDQLKN